MPYWPKAIPATSQANLINTVNACTATSQRDAVAALMGEAEADFITSNITYSETLFWQVYDATLLIPNTTERGAVLSLLNTYFSERPPQPGT